MSAFKMGKGMKAGRVMDCRVAEIIYSGKSRWVDDQCVVQVGAVDYTVQRYSTETGLAMGLVEKLSRQGWTVSMAVTLKSPGTKVTVQLRPEGKTSVDAIGEGDTIAEAICKALIKRSTAGGRVFAGMHV